MNNFDEVLDNAQWGQLRMATHFMPRGHGFSLDDLLKEDWDLFSEDEKSLISFQFFETFAIGKTPTLISLGVNEHGFDMYTKPFNLFELN